MTGIYFSGTGNTKHCAERFIQELDKGAKTVSIEDVSCIDEIQKAAFIIFAYPVYFSSLPKIVRDFIEENHSIFKGKKVFIIATMGLFSGDGTGCSARLFKKYGAIVVGGLHLKMPDCIADEKLLKKTLDQNRLIVKQAEAKIKRAAVLVKDNHPPQEGIGILPHIAGLFGQRLWFRSKTTHYVNKLKVNAEKCIGCGLCTQICPMQNLTITGQIAKQEGRCTMCYRCVNYCPNKAITLLGKTLYDQCRIEKYR